MSTYGLRRRKPLSLSLSLEEGANPRDGVPFHPSSPASKSHDDSPFSTGRAGSFQSDPKSMNFSPILQCFVSLQGKCGKCELYAKIAVRIHSNVSSGAAPLMTINLCDLANRGMEGVLPRLLSVLSEHPYPSSVGRSVRSKEIGAMNGE